MPRSLCFTAFDLAQGSASPPCVPCSLNSLSPRRSRERAALAMEGGAGMFSFWWIFLAFLGGGTAGVFLLALVRMAGDEPQASTADRELPSALS